MHARSRLVAQTRRISPGSGLPVATTTPCARPGRAAWSEPSPRTRNPTSSLSLESSQVRARPKRLDRLPQQYFVALLGRVAAAAAAGWAAARRSRPGQSRGGTAGARRRGARGERCSPRRARIRPDPGPRPHEGGAGRALPRRVRSRARSRARDRDRPGHKDGAQRARAGAGRRRGADPAPGPLLPRLSLRACARRRAARDRPAPRRCRLVPRPGRRARCGGALPQLPVEPLRCLCASQYVRGRRPLGRAHGWGGRPRCRLHRHRLRRAAPAELSRDPRRQGGRGRAVVDVEDVRHGGLAHRVRRRERGDRRARQPAERSQSGRHLRAAATCRDRRVRRAARLGRSARRGLRAPP